jgi:hypothetical protein
MGNFDIHPGAGETQTATGLSQWQRVGNIFVAPSKTFDDIKRGNTTWWLPFLIAVVFSYVLFAGITLRIGWQQVATNNMAMNPKQAQRLENLTPEQRANAMKVTGKIIEASVAASPIVILIFAALVSLILWGTINFGFGGKATYQQIFAVNMYAVLPKTITSIMATAAIFAGLAPDSFNLNNMAATNIAYFLPVQDTNRALYALLSQLDVIAIWVAIILSIGIAKAAGKNRGAGFATVFGWWAIWVLLLVTIAYVTS